MIRDIKPNSITHLSCLITGDRFYCWSDERKEVWELRYHTMVRFRGQQVKLSQCVNDNGDKKRFDFNRVVIFLRRTKIFESKRVYDPLDKFFA
jgi:hypothetical protein